MRYTHTDTHTHTCCMAGIKKAQEVSKIATLLNIYVILTFIMCVYICCYIFYIDPKVKTMDDTCTS